MGPPRHRRAYATHGSHTHLAGTACTASRAPALMQGPGQWAGALQLSMTQRKGQIAGFQRTQSVLQSEEVL